MLKIIYKWGRILLTHFVPQLWELWEYLFSGESQRILLPEQGNEIIHSAWIEIEPVAGLQWYIMPLSHDMSPYTAYTALTHNCEF